MHVLTLKMKCQHNIAKCTTIKSNISEDRLLETCAKLIDPQKFWKFSKPFKAGNWLSQSPEPRAPSLQPTAPSPRLPLSPPYRPKNGPDRYLTRKNRCNLYLTDALGSQIVEIITLRIQYVTTLLRNRRNPQLTRSLLISARAKKVVPARLLNLGR